MTTDELSVLRACMDEIQARAEAAEAEVQRLSEGLRYIQDAMVPYPYSPQYLKDKARALLADSPTDGGERHAEGLDERGIYGGRAYPVGGGAK